MERELKIVVSVFLVYFIYALTSYFNAGIFLAPYFLSKAVITCVALLIAVSHLKTPKNWLLWFYFSAALLFAITDENMIGLLDSRLDSRLFDRLSGSTAFLAGSFVIYFAFHLLMIAFYYRSHRRTFPALLLVLLLVGSILLFFNGNILLRSLFIHLFFVTFFYFAQQGSEMKDRVLRIIAYQYLLIPLLESFEYFI